MLMIAALQICSDDLQRISIGDEELPTELEKPPGNNDLYVRGVEQKGLGLSSLRESLELLNTSESPSANQGTLDDYEAEADRRFKQRQIEANVSRVALSRWRREFEEQQRKIGVQGPGRMDRVGTIMNEWTMRLASGIEKELERIAQIERMGPKSRMDVVSCGYADYLRALKPDRMAVVTIISLLGMFGRLGMNDFLKVARTSVEIGGDIQDEILADSVMEKASREQNRWRLKMLKTVIPGRYKDLKSRLRWREIMKAESLTLWPKEFKARLGAVLLSLLFDAARMPVRSWDPDARRLAEDLQPALYHSHIFRAGKKVGIIRLNPELVTLFEKEPLQDFIARHMPMICEPKPWTNWKAGGYELHHSALVRVAPSECLEPLYVQTALQKNGLHAVRRGLDVLGKTAWVINKDVFDVMCEAWNSGEAVGGLNPSDPDIPDPPRPSPDEGVEAERKWSRLMRLNDNKRQGLHSNRCFQNFQMEVARSFANENFYFPHNIDFRGRAYPIPSYLNQMGADNARGLLLFSKAKPLGERGLFWLKIQIANLYGFDKASFSEREQFVMDNLDDVLDSANNGLHSRRWWLEAEDPWQCLAACMELRNALRLSDPAQYASRLPIHQDGSCNGLQHYAALGGDTSGAQQVNLAPSDRPFDVYGGVSEYVQREISREAALGIPMAKLLDGRVTRKIVKQTVMTNVYGVTAYGALRQVCKHLDDEYPEQLDGRNLACASYIAKKIFDALGSMFAGAHEIQYWLGDCATRISQSLHPDQVERIAKAALSPAISVEPAITTSGLPKQFKQTVIWTTPLGLPVVQPYRVRKSHTIRTSLQLIDLFDGSPDATVSKRRQLQGFPPNFIHSLDATHMLMTAIACDDAGLTFSSVHDSFWTHACDIDTMNRILRDKFVDMHSDDVVRRLAAEFKLRYGSNMLHVKVRGDTSIAKEIRKVRKGSKKKGQIHELIAEYRRLTLLRSDDPEAQAQGRAMRTPGSVFEEKGGTHDDLIISRTLGSTAKAPVSDDNDLDSDVDLDSGIDMDDPALEKELSHSSDELEESAPSKGGKRGTKAPLYIWLPMSFRDVPKRGSFDVTRVRESKYFFS